MSAMEWLTFWNFGLFLCIDIAFSDVIENVYYNRAIMLTEQTSAGGVVFATFTGDSIYSCIKKCKERSACRFVNYKAVGNVCYLIPIVPVDVSVIVTDTSFIYSSKADWDMTDYQMCSICSAKEVCDISETLPKCIISECGPPTIAPSTYIEVVYGNMYSVGNGVLFKCVIGKSLNMCMSNGEWSVVTNSCSDPITTTTTTTSTATTTTTTTTATTTSTTTTPTTTTTTPMPTPTTTKAACAPDWYEFQSSCYYISQNSYTVAQAEYECASSGAYLADVKTADEMNFLTATYQAKFPDGENVKRLWLGGNDATQEGTFRWKDGTLLSSGFTFWHASQPDSLVGDEDCVVIDVPSGYTWRDIDCSTKYLFICEYLF